MKNPTKEDFLEVYKNLEDVLANNGFAWQGGGKGSVAQYEDTLPAESDVRRALQQCRMIRNGYQHENRVLFLPTSDAIKLLSDLIKQLDNRKCAKDVMTRPKKFLLSDKPVTPGALTNVITKGYVIPIVSDTGEYLGAVDEHVLLLMYTQSKNVQLKTFLSNPEIKQAVEKAAKIIDSEALATELEPDTVYAVIDKKNKYRGMIERW